MQPRLARPFVVLVVGAALLAGCSGSDDGADGESSRPPATTTEAPGGVRDPSAEPSAGCGREPDVASVAVDERPGDTEQVMDFNGNERLYRLGVPPAYDPETPVPLVLNLHGSGSNAQEASVYGDVPRAAAQRGMITVAAEAIGGQWELAGQGDDHDFLNALVDDVEARYCVDRNRVHIVGMSLGAWKAAATACGTEGRFASLSLVTVEVRPGTCEPMPVVAFHGRADRTVPYGEGGEVDRADTRLSTLPGAEQNVASWAEGGGCEPDPVIERVGEDVERRRFEGCAAGVSVELYSIAGGGHTWPGSDINLGPAGETTQTIDATELTLDFFEAHPRTAR
jgi:polyhydroxybutyrate depolymerase